MAVKKDIPDAFSETHASEEQHEEQHSEGQRRGKMQRIMHLVFPLVFIGAVLSAGYFYNQYRVLRNNPQRIAEEEVQDVMTQVGKLIVLPEGEAPTVATVTDAEPLKNQPFFVNAKNGDKVLIYTNARKAILYRPDENKLIEFDPLNLGTP